MASALTIRLDANDLQRVGALFDRAAHKGPVALARALNRTGERAKTSMIRVLPGQTGLKSGTFQRALKINKASAGGLVCTITSHGGDVALRYFGARETRRGVSAAPWNARHVYPHTFMKAGWWPKRVAKSNWNGQVFERAGSKTSRMDRFQKVKSGLYIPDEMISKTSEAAFNEAVESELPKRLEHELLRILS